MSRAVTSKAMRGWLSMAAVTGALIAAGHLGMTAPAAQSPRPGDPATGAAGAAANPGRLVVHRLTRVEYGNAIRDLLDLEIDPASLLPADESLQGFDNIGGALSVSPVLLERYLSAARRISRLAVGDPTIGPAFASKTYDAPQTVFQDARMSDDLPFGSRGGMAVRHRFPLDGDYVCRIRLMRNIAGYVRGLSEPHQLDVRVDGARVALFTVGGGGKGAPAPMGFTGVIAGDPAWEAYAPTADTGLEIRFHARAGTRVIGASFVDEPVEPEGVLQPRLTGLGFSYSEYASAPDGPWGPAVGSVVIDGPYNAGGPGETGSRTRIFTCRPEGPQDASPCARSIFSTLARRAYRRPVTDGDLARLFAFFTSGSTRAGFDAGIQSAIERLLVDPNFLFRIERDPAGIAPGAAYRLSGVELASRLSFFLWSTLPDDALLEAGVAGRLLEPSTLNAQVRRMMADPRADALVDNFAAQWLSLRQLRAVTPDPETFAEFDDGLREAFDQETRLFLRSQVQEDRPVPELLTAPYTFLNERLARHYGIQSGGIQNGGLQNGGFQNSGIQHVYGSHFRRVALSGGQRAGLLGHGSVLTLTSYPTRTSPVLRGRWLLDTVFGAPPPPPPANIPALPAGIENDRPLSMRERTERHRRNPACASCHVRMDPLGFALENFDAIGRWRTVSEAGTTIDASGAFPDGSSFVGASGLRALVSSRRDDLVRALTEKLMTYAIGRTVEPFDTAAIQAIVKGASAREYRWSALIEGIVASVPFQMRRAE